MTNFEWIEKFSLMIWDWRSGLEISICKTGDHYTVTVDNAKLDSLRRRHSLLLSDPDRQPVNLLVNYTKRAIEVSESIDNPEDFASAMGWRLPQVQQQPPGTPGGESPAQ